MSNAEFILENDKRLKTLYHDYNPTIGIGSPIERREFSFYDNDIKVTWYLPVIMFELPLIKELNGKSIGEISSKYNVEPYDLQLDLIQLRFECDFEFWAISCVHIQDKETKKPIPFKLNNAQLKLLKELERLRQSGTPIRIILLKARQWGGSTLVQIYMAWLQVCLKRNWHSANIADVENQSRNIRGMFSKMAETYPKLFGSITFKPHEGSMKTRVIAERGCIIGIGSVQKPESLRSFDFSMLHLSEVGLWKTTLGKSPEDLAQSLASCVPDEPDTLIVKESTAKGVGNYFHNEWLAAVDGRSADVPVFIPWYEIERYQKQIADYNTFIESLTDYDLFQWKCGSTLEGINWYRSHKTGKNLDNWRMMSEYPTTDLEAFQSTGRRAFAPLYVSQARRWNLKPEFIGELTANGHTSEESLENITFQPDIFGGLSLWAMPDKSMLIENRYVVSVDIGGRSEGADWSIIRVFDRYAMMDGGVTEAIGTWKGHVDQDRVIWKATQLAKFFNNALLIPEQNSLDKEESEGDHFLTVLDEIVPHYENIFARTDPEKIRQGLPIKYGFHTSPKTKPMIITLMNAALRDGEYTEYDKRVCDEYDTYEIKPNGTYGAVDGCHDDLVMSTAIGLWACLKHLELPKVLNLNKGIIKRGHGNESTFT